MRPEPSPTPPPIRDGNGRRGLHHGRHGEVYISLPRTAAQLPPLTENMARSRIFPLTITCLLLLLPGTIYSLGVQIYFITSALHTSTIRTNSALTLTSVRSPFPLYPPTLTLCRRLPHSSSTSAGPSHAPTRKPAPLHHKEKKYPSYCASSARSSGSPLLGPAQKVEYGAPMTGDGETAGCSARGLCSPRLHCAYHLPTTHTPERVIQVY